MAPGRAAGAVVTSAPAPEAGRLTAAPSAVRRSTEDVVQLLDGLVSVLVREGAEAADAGVAGHLVGVLDALLDARAAIVDR
jgi:hypothetical protein